ncbi:MAG: hypothetical protein KTR26_16860 [Flammeovirgaceae bacterium]|nr:hypothetical protein [Flammeovirgaceae bacterium]
MAKKESSSLQVLEMLWNREHKLIIYKYLRNEISHKQFIEESFKTNQHYKAKIDKILPHKFSEKSK